MAGKKKLTGKNLKNSMKMLQKVTQIMEKNGTPYWLEGGTLLGIVREKRLLPWDNDMDISLVKDNEKKLLSILFKIFLRGYIVRVKKYKFDVDPFKKGEVRIVKIRNRKFLFIKGDATLDIFFKRKKNDEYFWTVGVKKPVLKSVPKIFYEELAAVNFNGKTYSVPKDYDGYLTYRYGDRKTPVKEWNFKKDDRAINKI